MIIYPAIDIRGGNCVRLYQGNYAQETIYSDSPQDMANQFFAKGAAWLHLVDLDGAKNPDANQAVLIKKLLQSVPIAIQVGGGIRHEKQLEAYFASGAARVVIGSLAIESQETVVTWMKKYGAERFVLAFDVLFAENKPYVMTQAWQKVNNIVLFDVIAYFIDHGLQHILCTDITRDGVLNGPNRDWYQRLVSQFPTLAIQASGGISSLDDIRHLKNSGLAGTITGRALYENKFDLSEALSC